MDEQETFKYSAEYYHDGGWWEVVIYAYNDADALARCKKLGLQYNGPILFTAPGWLGYRIPAAICSIRNFFHNLFKD